MTTPRIGIVRWADPTGDDPAVYFSLRVDGAYVRKSGVPVGYRSAAEARRAKAELKRQLTIQNAATSSDATPQASKTGSTR